MYSAESSLRLLFEQNRITPGLLRPRVRNSWNGRLFQPQYHSTNKFSFNFQRAPTRNRSGDSFTVSNIRWNEETLTPFRKDFYKEHPSVANRNSEEVRRMREESKMLVFGKNFPNPFQSWEESGIPSKYLKNLSKMGINEPTPIQKQGIPLALSGNDMIGISRTGSGKTLTYVLPLLVHVEAQPIAKQGDGPIGLILAPTRELVQQINEEIRKYASVNEDIIMKHAAVYGGADRDAQIRRLRDSPDILVATPGRLLDLTSVGQTNFKRTTYLVLDEADRMLDMGFRRDLEKILSYVRPDKQLLMWSATWPKEIQQISNAFMKSPLRVQIGSTDLHANDQIEQIFKHINQNDKLSEFLKDISEIVEQQKKCLVFVNQKRVADNLENLLQDRGIHAKAIHGDKTQPARDKIMNGFRTNSVKILIATDVVARGIDVKDIDVVLVYDFPNNVEDYIHRIGRTARGHDSGIALTYLKNDDITLCRNDLVAVLKKSNQKIPDFLEPKFRSTYNISSNINF